MPNIYFKSLNIQNFMSFGQSFINLDRKGNVLVGGKNNNPEDSAKSNGCGKSSLFSAICWCLTGETIGGSNAVENIYTDGKTSVTLTFSVDKDNYTVTRTKNPSNLFFSKNGENLSGKGIRDTSKIVSEHLPQLTSSLINSVIILGQGLPQKFTSNTPSGRKEVLEKLSNSDFMITDLKNRLTDRKTILDKNKRECEDAILKINTLIESAEFDIKKINEELTCMMDESQVSKLIEDLEFNLQASKTHQTEAIDWYDDLRQQILDVSNEHVEMLRNKQHELNEVGIPDTRDLEQELIEARSEIKALEAEIKRNDSVRDVCPTCGQKLQGVTKIDTTAQKEELAVKKSEASEVQDKIDEIVEENARECQKIHDKYREILEGLESRKRLAEKEKTDAEASLNKYNKQVEDQEKRLSELKSKRDSLVSEKEYKLTKIKDLELCIKNYREMLYNNNEQLELVEKQLGINSKLFTLIKRDFRGYLLHNVISFIEDTAKEYAVEVFGSDKLKFELAGNNINISYDDKDYSCLSGGEKQKLDVIIQLAIRQMLCTFLDFSSNILVLDEITDALDVIGVGKIFDLIDSTIQDVEALYIVSHHADELEIPADDEIIIIKGDDKISRIV